MGCKYIESTRDIFYVRRVVDLMKKAKVNAYIMYIYLKLKVTLLFELLNISLLFLI